jgi:hypothetical protein
MNKTGLIFQLETQIYDVTCQLDLATKEGQKNSLSTEMSNQKLKLEPAISLLFNLEAARQGRSVLFSDEQKLLF